MHGLQLGWKYSWASPVFLHFCTKKGQFWTENLHFCTKNVDFPNTPRLCSLEAQGLDDLTGHPGDPNRGQTRFLRASALRNSANPGRSWPRSLRGRKRATGGTPCLTTDGRFEAKLPPPDPPGSLPDPPRPPRRVKKNW